MANAPAGWDATTYQNFKTANPTLEPDAQDTAKMMGGELSTQNGVQGIQRGNQWTNLAYATPSTPPVITASSLTPQTPMNLAPTPVNTTASQVIAEGANMAQYDQQVASDRAKMMADSANVNDLATQLGMKGAETAQLQESQGINKMDTELANNNAEILGIQNAMQNEANKINNLPGGSSYGKQLELDKIQNDNAYRINTIRISNDILTNNINGVQKRIDSAIALKYNPIQTKLDLAKWNFDNNKDFFNKSEERQFTLQHEAQKAKLEQQRKDFENKLSLIPKAMENGIKLPADVVAYLTDSKTTYAQALQKMGERGISLAKPTSGGGSAPTVKSINGVDMQWNPSTGKWENIGDNSFQGTKTSVAQLDFLANTAKDALSLSGASGRSALRRGIEEKYIGSTNYTKLVSLTNTLKTNVLSIMTDPNIKKFFGPQMSNADVLLMTSAGTTLNPELNSSDQMKQEIKRLDDLFKRMKASIPSETSATKPVDKNTEALRAKYNY